MFRYANGGSSAWTLGLSVNGTTVPGGVRFAPTGSWATWAEATVSVPLAVGADRIRLFATGQSGPNLDSLGIRRAAPPAAPTTLQAESAALSGPIVASNLRGFTGSGFADYQHGKGDYIEFTLEAIAAGDYVLQFRYANGSTSARPLELKMNGEVAQPGLSFNPTGKWSTWGTAAVTVRLSAGANKIRLTSIGQNGPNVGALVVTPTTA